MLAAGSPGTSWRGSSPGRFPTPPAFAAANSSGPSAPRASPLLRGAGASSDYRARAARRRLVHDYIRRQEFRPPSPPLVGGTMALARIQHTVSLVGTHAVKDG